MNKNQRGFAPVIIILVVLIGFVGFYYLRDLGPRAVITDPSSSPIATVVSSSKPTVPTTKPTTDPTVNWKIYINSKYGFSFKYPEDWKATLSPVTGEEFNLIVDKKSNLSETGFVPIQFSINMSKDENGNARSITTLTQAEEAYKISSSQTKKDRVIDNKPAVSITGLVEGPGPGTGQFLSYTFVKLNNGVLVAQLGNKEFQTVFDQILSTFKFTN